MQILPRTVEALLCLSLDQMNVLPGSAALWMMDDVSEVKTLKASGFVLVKMRMGKCRMKTVKRSQLVVLSVVRVLTPSLPISLLRLGILNSG